jgi:predicted lipid-binding transport protein (Tim44 family)
MKSLGSRFNDVSAEVSESSTGSNPRNPPPSIFGIIVVGLLAGLVAGLLAGPNFTLQGFFLGFAGGALITVGLYFYSAERSRPAR